MAPSLVGTHSLGTCSECGYPNYCSPDEVSGGIINPLAICEHFHVTEKRDSVEQSHSGDRVLVLKFLKPQRWDLVVFKYPENPATPYVKRLVGLPGETIIIRNGDVYADGKRLTLPDHLKGLKYESEMPGWYQEVWGSEEHPAVLNKDEFFVLGDFSARSKDSRLWVNPVPGHHPYAVPQSHMIGVVTHIYWPKKRWRIIR